MTEELLCPPWPVDTTTLFRLIPYLRELRQWLLHYRFWANESAATLGYEGELIPPEEQIPEIPTIDRFHFLAVVDIFKTFSAMRMLREQWDEMVRTYEQAWEVPRAIRARLRCVMSGYMLLREAFISPETREARQATMNQEMQKALRRFAKKIGLPPGIRPQSLSADGEGNISLYGSSDPLESTFEQLFDPSDDDTQADEQPEEKDEETSEDEPG